MSQSDAELNRQRWDALSDEYQERHRETLGRAEARWGMWQIPESELLILGDVSGLDLLEYGCGAAQWSILLARQGARPVGMDNSARQLEHARAAGADFPLVHAAAGEAPFPDESFDIVFCDHGAMTFADPDVTVPEVARLLRPEGLLAFSHTTPLSQLCWRDDEEVIDPELHRPYFGLARVEWEDEPVAFTRTQGEWFKLFRAHGLSVERLQEVQPPEGAVSTYRNDQETDWARRWPMEQIWAVRKWT